MLQKILATAAAMMLLITPSIASDRSEVAQIAREYMNHYSAANMEAMEEFLAEEVIFSDPTAMGPNIDADGIYHEGRDEAVAALREFVESAHPIELGFIWDIVFESNGRVVFIGEVNALYPTEKEGQVFRWRSPQVTVVTIRDGKVVRHVDYANYAVPDRSLLSR